LNSGWGGGRRKRWRRKNRGRRKRRRKAVDASIMKGERANISIDENREENGDTVPRQRLRKRDKRE
jgi:hypothetical protein